MVPSNYYTAMASPVLMLLMILFGLNINTVLVEGRIGREMMASNGSSLSYDFYSQSCPQLADIISSTLRTSSLTDPTTPSSVLRLIFHDCQVQGCDASILLDSVTSEMVSDHNFGVRKREVIGEMKRKLEKACPRVVSCADILVLAARESVAISFGPKIDVPLGRRDSATPPNNTLADALLPPPDLSIESFINMFADKGMTEEEAVAIMGSHTLGVVHCFNVEASIGKGFIPSGFEVSLKLTCPFGSKTPNITFVTNDNTAFIFDNQYFKKLVSKEGVLRIDNALASDLRTAAIVKRFANDQKEFFRAFSAAFVKLSTYKVLTGQQGMIRTKCNSLN